MSSLPTEIITHEIFSKLPVKSLCRFKCVSKSFNALMSSPEFIQLHLRESRSSDANRLILVGGDGRNLHSTDVESPDESVTTIPIPCTPDESRSHNVSVVGSVDGLICVVLESDGGFGTQFKHFLINPSTRVFREIPYKSTPMASLLENNIQSSFGFGFDDLNRNFKLVKITDVTISDVTYRKVMVYSLNENTWKLVEDVKDPIDLLMDRPNGVLIKKHLLHWVFSDSNDYRIGCFDTRTDKWASDVPLTMNLFEHDEFRVTSLGVIDGCLCLSAAMKSSEDVWILKEYEAKESWVKLFHLSPFFRSRFFKFTQPFFCFRRESKYEVLVPYWNRNGLYWYDIGPITYGNIKNVKKIPAFVGGCFFTESLVQIPGGCHLN